MPRLREAAERARVHAWMMQHQLNEARVALQTAEAADVRAEFAERDRERRRRTGKPHKQERIEPRRAGKGSVPVPMRCVIAWMRYSPNLPRRFMEAARRCGWSGAAHRMKIFWDSTS